LPIGREEAPLSVKDPSLKLKNILLKLIDLYN